MVKQAKKHINVLGYLSLWVGVLAAFGYGEWERQNREKDVARAIQINCGFGNQNRAALRNLLADANRRTQTSRQRTAEERKEAQEFFEEQIKNLKPFDCDAIINP